MVAPRLHDVPAPRREPSRPHQGGPAAEQQHPPPVVRHATLQPRLEAQEIDGLPATCRKDDPPHHKERRNPGQPKPAHGEHHGRLAPSVGAQVA